MSRLLRALESYSKLIIFASVVWLATLGTIFVISATEYLASWHHFLQFLFLGMGFLAFTLTASIDYAKLARYAWLLYPLALYLLLATLLWGHGRWLEVGPLHFQPYEFTKIIVVLLLASLLAKRGNLNNFYLSTFLPFLLILPPIFILICQPHFGACVIVFLTFFVMLILRGVRLSHLLWVGVIGILLLSLLLVLAPYRIQRLIGLFVEDPLGKDYHVNQSLIAIGSGGPWGKGIGNSVMKFGLLPEAHTDFLFAIIAEELGFVLTCILVLIPLGLFLLSCYAVSFSAPTLLGALVAGGLASLFAIQVLINLAMVSTKLVPVVGLPLPFFAYGGSSLISSCIAAGIVLNIARHKEAKRF